MKKSKGTGGNVQLGPYAKEGAARYSHGAAKTYAGTHRMNAAAPKIKGHHFMGGGSKKTGKAFK
jgi:hypothetical protein